MHPTGEGRAPVGGLVESAAFPGQAVCQRLPIARLNSAHEESDLEPSPCDTAVMPIDPLLLDILVCPLSKAPLREVDGALISTDPETRMRYRIDGTIPVMLVEEAERMEEDEWKAAMTYD